MNLKWFFQQWFIVMLGTMNLEKLDQRRLDYNDGLIHCMPKVIEARPRYLLLMKCYMKKGCINMLIL